MTATPPTVSTYGPGSLLVVDNGDDTTTLVVGGQPYTKTQTPVLSSSGNVANASAAATMAAVAGKTNYLSGFDATASGATAASVVTLTITGLFGGTRSYTFTVPAGATTAAQPLSVTFSPPLPASAVNTAITVTLPALGPGNTNATVNAQGFYQ